MATGLKDFVYEIAIEVAFESFLIEWQYSWLLLLTGCRSRFNGYRAKAFCLLNNNGKPYSHFT